MGVAGMSLKEGDYIEHLFITTTHHYRLFFPNGASLSPQSPHSSRGWAARRRGATSPTCCRSPQGERIQSVIATKEFNEAEYLLFDEEWHRQEDDVLEYNKTRQERGIIAVNLADDDELISVRQVSEGADVVIVTRNGKGIRFAQSDARPRPATGGVKGIRSSKTT